MWKVVCRKEQAMASSGAIRILDSLQALYDAGFQDPFLDSALQKILQRQIERDEADLNKIESEIARFEEQHSLNSEEFYREYQAGRMGDSAEFVEWNVFCKMRQRIEARLHILRREADGERSF
jgi:hypothetical protein